MMMSLMMMTIVPVISVTWKLAVTSTWKMKNCSIEEGYNIYSEPYVKWLLKTHPKETPTDWITHLNKTEKGILNGITLEHVNTMLDTYICTIYTFTYMCVVSGVTKSKGLKNTSVHSDSLMVPHGSQQSDITLEEEGDANEQLYQKRFEANHLANHPNDVPSEWLTEVSTSSVMLATITASQPDKSTKSDKIVLNYSTVYEALNKITKNQEDQKILKNTFLSTCIRLWWSGARVLTGDEAIKIMQDKEDEKKEKALEKEEERERKKSEKMVDAGLKKMPTQEASVKLTNEKKRKSKGKATVKTQEICPICMQLFQKVSYDMGDWIECTRTVSIMYLLNRLSVLNVYNEFCSVTYALCYL